MKKTFFCAALLVLAILPLHAQRQSQELASAWKFIKLDVDPAAPTNAWESVTVPHTWNGVDGQVGLQPGATATGASATNLYYRGVGWYARALDIPGEWQGKRVFLRFEAASSAAKVYVNGQLVGEHRGAFTAFCFEITSFVKFGQPNELRVRVTNALDQTIAPLSGDFNLNGGIYRPVHLFTTDPICISPLVFASPGVFLTLRSLHEHEALVEVKTLVSNGLATPADTLILTEIKDARGQTVATKQNHITIIPSTTPQPVVQLLAIPDPRKWNGEADPYLYSATVQIVHINGPVTEVMTAGQLKADRDEVTQPLGLRTVEITDADGFLLNGQPYPIHGVDRHQDMRDHAWAMNPADHERDLSLMLEMGVTAIRLAHYPQSEYFHDLCDKAGMLLWNEVPFVNALPTTANDYAAFDDNLEQQMREMILQRYNHPSVAFWGLFNELRANPTSTNALPEVERLNALAHELDRTRLTVCATNRLALPTNFVADWPCYNIYPGWYDSFGADSSATIKKQIDDRIAEQGGRRIAFSEYGAGGNPEQHVEGKLTAPKANNGPLHPEEWQNYVHEQDYAQIKDNAHVWGSFLWVMFDFASAGRQEGGKDGTNDKGMITADRQIKKDVFYFYKANWTTAPMVYITDRRLIDRTQAVTEVKIYSNCDSVQLSVNGQDLGTVKPDRLCIARFPNVTLQLGQNTIVAKGQTSAASGTPIQDSCEWTLAPAPGAAK